jgi:hypothetical protein
MFLGLGSKKLGLGFRPNKMFLGLGSKKLGLGFRQKKKCF